MEMTSMPACLGETTCLNDIQGDPQKVWEVLQYTLTRCGVTPVTPLKVALSTLFGILEEVANATQKEGTVAKERAAIAVASSVPKTSGGGRGEAELTKKEREERDNELASRARPFVWPTVTGSGNTSRAATWIVSMLSVGNSGKVKHAKFSFQLRLAQIVDAMAKDQSGKISAKALNNSLDGAFEKEQDALELVLLYAKLSKETSTFSSLSNEQMHKDLPKMIPVLTAVALRVLRRFEPPEELPRLGRKVGDLFEEALAEAEGGSGAATNLSDEEESSPHLEKKRRAENTQRQFAFSPSTASSAAAGDKMPSRTSYEAAYARATNRCFKCWVNHPGPRDAKCPYKAVLKVTCEVGK